jgi:hypothetical protein
VVVSLSRRGKGGSLYLERHACLDALAKHLGNYTIKVLQHLDGDLRGYTAFGDELVERICHGGADAVRVLVTLVQGACWRAKLPAAPVQLVVVLLRGCHGFCETTVV